MSESDSETGGIRDEDLPEDLQPKEENPLAEPLDEDVDRRDLDVRGGKAPEGSDDDEDDEDDRKGGGASTAHD
jgi:hypothetical protein